MKRVTIVLACLATALSAVHGVSAEDDQNGNEVKSSADVANAAPANAFIDLTAHDDDPSTPGTQISPVPNGVATIPVHASVDDGNGWKDITSATITVTAPDGSNVPATNAAASSEGGHGRTTTYEATYKLSASSQPGEYAVHFSATDHAGANASADAHFVYMEMLGIAIDSKSISFGSGLSPGNTTDASGVTVHNVGNVKIDLHVSASPLTEKTSGVSIGPERIGYSQDSSMAGEVPLSADGYADTAFQLAPGSQSAKSAFFNLHVPSGDEQYLPPGTYTGQLTLGAMKG
ncbi:MAG: hypothetical protein WDA16_04935 [Candidatus Thermoplasmatota archaeon]